MKLMTCVCERTQIEVGTNYLQVIFHLSTVSHVCMPPPQSKVIFKNGADGQKADGQRDRKGDSTADSRSTRHKSPMVGPFNLACRVESRGGDDVYRDRSLSLSHWCREAFLVSQVIYSGLD